jgi:PAS domain S-box-containing protein
MQAVEDRVHVLENEMAVEKKRGKKTGVRRSSAEADPVGLTQRAFEGLVVSCGRRIVYCNASFARMVGRKLNEIRTWSAERLQTILHPDDRERVMGYYANRISGGKSPSEYDCRIVKPDGTVVWLRFLVGLCEYEGTPAVRAACTDVTGQKQAEEALRQSEEQLRHVIANTRDVIFRIDPKGNYRYANVAAERMTGYSLERLLRMNMLELVAPEYHELVTSRLRQRIAGLTPDSPFEFQIVHRDGHRIWTELTTTGIRDGDGRLVAVQGVARDVTARKETEQALQRESQERLRSLFRDAAVGAAVISPEGRFLQVNPALCSLLGYAGSELIGKSVFDVTHPDDYELSTVRLARAREGRSSVEPAEKRFVHKDGRTVWGEVSLVPVRDSKGQLLFSIGQVVDITGRKLAEDALRRARDELERKVRERTSQLRALAGKLMRAEHEERQRLVRILHDDLQQLLVGARFTSGRIAGCVTGNERRKVAGVLDGALAKAIAVSRTLTLNLRPPVLFEVGLGAAVAWLAEQVRLDHGLAVRVHGAHVVGPPSDEIRDFVFQAVREFVFNVVKHAGVKRATVRLTHPGDGGIQAVVKDRGKGFDAAHDRPNRLGMIGIRERAVLLGGDLDVVSAPGQGTTVTLTLPAQSAPPRSPESPERLGNPPRTRRAGRRPAAAAAPRRRRP